MVIKSFINFRFTSRFQLLFYNVCVFTYFINPVLCNTLNNTLFCCNILLLKRWVTIKTIWFVEFRLSLCWKVWLVYLRDKMFHKFCNGAHIFIRKILTNYGALKAFNFSGQFFKFEMCSSKTLYDVKATVTKSFSRTLWATIFTEWKNSFYTS